MIATVAELWQYPVKSTQGHQVDSLKAHERGFVGDRVAGFVHAETGKLLSAKRYGKLFDAVGFADHVELDDGTSVAFADRSAPQQISDWLGVPVAIARAGESQLSYEMSFGPFTEQSPVLEIPAAPSTLLDLAAAHLISTATLRHGAAAEPDMNWDVRRFRPNIVVDTGDHEPFIEDGWCGSQVKIGDAVFAAMMTTIRCAMPLRAQPGVPGAEPLAAQPGMFDALTAVHGNCLGIYLSVDGTGDLRVGDAVEVL